MLTLTALFRPSISTTATAIARTFLTGAHLPTKPHLKLLSTMKTYDAIVLGSGQAGTPLAGALARSGRKTALIESTHVGGTCVNVGCTPTKTMVASARVAYLARRGKDYGVSAGNGDVVVDMEVVRKRKRDIVTSFRGGSERRLKGTEGLDVIMGRARFTGKKELQVEMEGGEKETVKAEEIFINTGGIPAPLEVPGADTIDVLNSTTVMELDVVPGHLVVIGGGYVGLEFAHMFRRFGSAVTVIQRASQLLGREDPDIAHAVKEVMTQDGLTILLNTNPVSVAKTADGISVEVSSASGTQKIECSHILSAAGRLPATSSLSLDATSVEVDKHGFIKVSPSLETSCPGIYSLGDVKGGPAFTHISYDDYRIIRSNLLDTPKPSSLVTTTNRLVPYTVYTDPQLGRVGINETEARTLLSSNPSRKLGIAKMPMAYVARALETDESRGLIKVIVDLESELILGATVFGIEGGEIMSMLQIAMMGGVKYSVLREGVFAHPTYAELLNNLFGVVGELK
jgi:pyruvate/2-oxoglutarate dehydrogenase complex dihydrolipoamide dehydrogenase (E3) component